VAVNWSRTRDVVLDVATRYTSGVSEDLIVLFAAWIVMALWLWMTVQRIDIKALRYPLLLVVCAAGLWWAWSLRWIADDAFISLRYARNLIEGHGLVYNVGERVEGYTNFLWTVLMASAGAVGFDLAQTSIVMTLFCFALAIIVVAALSARLSEADGTSFFPLAAAAFAANYASSSFGTSGLETMFCTLAVVFALERALAGSHFWAGLAGIAATMAHPDHALFYAGLGVAILLGKPGRVAVMRYALPFVIFFVPYFAWRWHYYGYFFPNTFYAKSGGGWHIQQGARYLGLCAISLGLWGAFPLALYEAYKRRYELVGRYALIVFPVYLIYLLKVGGDFMLGRFVVVLLPLVFVLGEHALRRLARDGRLKTACVAALAFSFCVLPNQIIRPGEKFQHVADERTFYRLASFSPIKVSSGYSEWAGNLKELFPESTATPRVATGVVGIFGYETGFHVIDIWGLLDPVVAHKPIRRRGRPGHEKRGSPGRIVEAGTDLSDMSVYPRRFEAWTKVRVAPFPLYMPRYDRALVARLNADGRKRARVFEPHLDRLRPSADPAVRDCQHWFAEAYYFSSNEDPERKSELQERFAAAGDMDDPRELLFDDAPPGWTPHAVESFDADSGLTWRQDADPPFQAVTSGIRPDQRFVFGQQGTFVNSFGPEAGEGARLTMTSSPFEVVGEALVFSIGGGRADTIQVELLNGGVPVRSATGCESDLMGRRIWDVRALRGQLVELRIRDNETGPWGYVLVDAFEQWSRQ
jgi:hypothetical protein